MCQLSSQCSNNRINLKNIFKNKFQIYVNVHHSMWICHIPKTKQSWGGWEIFQFWILDVNFVIGRHSIKVPLEGSVQLKMFNFDEQRKLLLFLLVLMVYILK